MNVTTIIFATVGMILGLVMLYTTVTSKDPLSKFTGGLGGLFGVLVIGGSIAVLVYG
jgi:hypothetical protein